MLARMRALPFWQDKAIALYDKVERGMIEQGSSLVLCAFSATIFNIASLVEPDWHDFATHLPSLFTLLGVVTLMLAGLVVSGVWLVHNVRANSAPNGV